MDVFELRHRLIADYSDYIQSFINIRDDRIKQQVDNELRNGLLWPEPLLQLNPSFEPGPWIDDLAASGILHPECKSIFRIKEQGKEAKPLRLHKHQADAVLAAATGDSYVVTTGTGSGKSLAYIVPIVDYVLRKGSGQGIRAIVVYPMNALANSQLNELEKFLGQGYPQNKPPVTYRRYTGQEKDEERAEILANPPDILLTNYVMLELLLTRPHEKKIVNAAKGHLQFLVLDELHTYRGRQGADVSLLVRRVRNVCGNPHLQCVGTSATLAGGGTFQEQQRQIASVASRLFGTVVKPERIIGETLKRVTVEYDLADSSQRAALKTRVEAKAEEPPCDFVPFTTDPLASWIESTFGLATEPGTGRLKRARPIAISGLEGAAQQLAQTIDVPVTHYMMRFDARSRPATTPRLRTQASRLFALVTRRAGMRSCGAMPGCLGKWRRIAHSGLSIVIRQPVRSGFCSGGILDLREVKSSYQTISRNKSTGGVYARTWRKQPPWPINSSLTQAWPSVHTALSTAGTRSRAARQWLWRRWRQTPPRGTTLRWRR